MKRIGLLLGLILGLSFSAWADGANYGNNESASQMGAGARATGLGGAYVAVADDATAPYWNPAGLGQMELYLYELGAQYAVLPDSMYSGYLAYAFQVPEVGAFSLAWNNFTLGNITSRDEAGNSTGELTAGENVFYFSYGRKMYDWVNGLYLGVNLKILQQTMGGSSGTGLGADLGLIWQPILWLDHTFGVNVQNLYQHVYWQRESRGVDISPVNLKAGVALRFLPSEEALYFHHLLTTADVDYSESARFEYHVGLECWPNKNFGARAGINSREMTAGVSYRPDHYELDYAFHYDLTELANHQHRISFLLRLDTAPLSPVPGISSHPPASRVPKNEAGNQEAPNQQEAAVLHTAIPPLENGPEDSLPHGDIPTIRITAKILEIQRLGGRANKVIINIGSNQKVRRGYHGTLVDADGMPVAGIMIRQVDPGVSLAEVLGIAMDLENNASAIVEIPLEK